MRVRFRNKKTNTQFNQVNKIYNTASKTHIRMKGQVQAIDLNNQLNRPQLAFDYQESNLNMREREREN